MKRMKVGEGQMKEMNKLINNNRDYKRIRPMRVF